MSLPYRLMKLEQRAELLKRVGTTGQGPAPSFCPHRPWTKQEAFLSLDCLEALYGGACGGGKSDCLLMAALQYVHVPGYSALILRRDFQRLALPGALMDRSKEWLHGTGSAWNEQAKRWTFPSGATLQFGYIDAPADRLRYASSEFQFVGWDELTEFALTDDESNPYAFLFSRLRKTRDMDVPLRVRAASNPGGPSHMWVKSRFITPESATAIERGVDGVFDGPDGRKFVPAAIRDNPALDPDQYEANLAHLPPVTRARLMRGNWDVTESLVIPPEWLRRYTAPTGALRWGDGRTADTGLCRRFATIDTAGTSRDKADAARGRAASWSVVAVWDHIPTDDLLFLRHVWRARVEWSELKANAATVLQDWGVRSVRIENAHCGPMLRDELRAAGDVQLIGPTLPGMIDGYRGAKLERAIAGGLLNRLERGGLLVPQDATWLPDYERELTSWGGLPDEPADQIDCSSYASWECKRTRSSWGGVVTSGGLGKVAGVASWPSSVSSGVFVGAGGLKRSW